MTQRSRRQERQRQRAKRKQTTTLMIIGGIALVVAAIMIVPNLLPVGEIVEIAPKAYPMTNANTMGDPNAPVTIIEYSDFQCPYCKRFSDQTKDQIINAYVVTGQVYFIFRSYGEWIGPESLAAAEAAYCAGDQNQFWQFHDMLFANQTGENVGAYRDNRLVAFGEYLGLDMDAFNACFNGHDKRDQAQQDLIDGQNAGVQGTPAFFINGQLLQGAEPFSEFQALIEEALAGDGE